MDTPLGTRPFKKYSAPSLVSEYLKCVSHIVAKKLAGCTEIHLSYELIRKASLEEEMTIRGISIPDIYERKPQ